MIKLAAEAAITRALADQPIDAVITTGKSRLAVWIADALQRHLDMYGLGVQIHAVNLIHVAPPPEVADAFAEASRARSDKERLRLEAERYRAETLAKARAEAETLINQAIAERDKKIDLARAEAARFLSLWQQYRYSPAITIARLYLETLSEILPKLQGKILVDTGSGVDLSIIRKEQ